LIFRFSEKATSHQDESFSSIIVVNYPVPVSFKEIVATLCPGKYYPYTEVLNYQLPTLRFRDVPHSYIFYPAIELIAQKGIMNGDSEGTFRPGDPVTRGELAQVMVNFLTHAGEL